MLAKNDNIGSVSMENILTRIDSIVLEFLTKINPQPKYTIKELDICKDVRESQDWSDWSDNVGVYVFIEENKKIHYVGRALRNTLLGARIWAHTQFASYPETNEWGRIIRNKNVKIRLYKFSCTNDDYWVAGLELYLIDKFDPIQNDKRG